MVIGVHWIRFSRLLKIFNGGVLVPSRFDYPKVVIDLGKRKATRDQPQRASGSIDISAVISGQTQKEVRLCSMFVRFGNFAEPSDRRTIIALLEVCLSQLQRRYCVIGI